MLMLLRAGRRGAFSPLSIPGLALWLDASQLTLTDLDPVTTWTDLSGNARHATQATLAKKPTFRTNQQNGKPGVVFDGVDDGMAYTGFSFQAFTFMAVIKINNAPQTHAILSGVAGSATFNAEVNTQKLVIERTMFASIGTSTGTIALIPAVAGVTYTTPNAAFYKDGSDIGTVSSAQTFTQPMTLLGSRSADQFAHATFFEITAYLGVPSGASMLQLARHLGAKWGIVTA